MALRTRGPPYPLCHLPDPGLLISAEGSLTCLGIGQRYFRQPLAALLGLERTVLA